MQPITELKKVHVVGVGGIGVSAVAKLLHHHGVEVSGTDLGDSEIIRDLGMRGIAVTRGHAEQDLPDDAALVIRSGAVPLTNPEMVKAKRLGIPAMTYFEFLGAYAKDKKTITVSGTNGKSTTTAMLGLMLIEAGMDPTVIVGSKVPGFPDGNLRIGKSDLFVVEACEHEANMLHFSPDLALVTNIEEDHLDFYRDRAHIVETFQKYIDGIREGGTLVLNGDDHEAFYELQPTSRFVTCGTGPDVDYLLGDIAVGEGDQTFGITRMRPREETMGKFRLRVPGRFNVANALMAIAAATELGAGPEAIRSAVEKYGGIWRRFEFMGERDGAVVISDYGHHPTAIRGTLEAAREFYPGWRIVLAFQPHQHNRTKRLFKEFVAAMDAADIVIIGGIFDVAGREEDEDRDVSAQALVEAMVDRDGERGVTRHLVAMDDAEGAREELSRVVRPGDLVLIVGAGDIYRIAAPFARGGYRNGETQPSA